MAVAYETSAAGTNVTFLAAGETETFAFDAGTGANRVLLVGVLWRDRNNDISGITYNSVAMTSVAAKITEGTIPSLQLWYLASPASGSNNVAVTMGAGDNNSLAIIGCWVGNGADTGGTVLDGYQSGTGNVSTANAVSSLSAAVSSAVGDRAVFFCGQYNETANITATATNYTERQDGDNTSGMSLTWGDADGAATVNPSATWNNGAYLVRWCCIGVNINATGGGGTAVPVFVHHLKQQGFM